MLYGIHFQPERNLEMPNIELSCAADSEPKKHSEQNPLETDNA
jgi:hypothetical protein